MTATLYFAAVVLDTKVVAAALLGYSIYVITHFIFHVTHFDNFSFLEAVGVGTGLGVEVVLALLLIYVTWLVHRTESAAARRAEAR